LGAWESGFRWLNLKTAVETMKPQGQKLKWERAGGMGWVSAFQRFPCRGEAGLLGHTLQIRVHLCSSVVELLFLGLADASM